MNQSIEVSTVMKAMVVLLLMIMSLSVPAIFGANALPKVNKHKDRDVACESCHKNNLPYTGTDDDTCMSCHGSYADLAKKTARFENIKVGVTNPHKSHIGDARCTVCHKNHAQSVLYCNQCHSPKFDMKVP